MRVGAIIQARMSSSRLYGKVLKELPYGSGITVLEQIVKRIKTANKIDEVIIATSIDEDDNPIEEIGKKINTPVFRGSLENVLERFYFAATKFKYDVVVRITGDCPCIDAEIIDNVIEKHIHNKSDFTTISAIKRTFPKGIDIGIFNYKSLKTAYTNAIHNYEKEHVTAYFYKSHPENFKILSIEADKNYNFPELRLTLDTKNDYTFLCAIYDYLYSKNKTFNLESIIKLIEQKPWLKNINEFISQKKIHPNLNSELTEVLDYCYKQGLEKATEFIKSPLKRK